MHGRPAPLGLTEVRPAALLASPSYMFIPARFGVFSHLREIRDLELPSAFC